MAPEINGDFPLNSLSLMASTMTLLVPSADSQSLGFLVVGYNPLLCVGECGVMVCPAVMVSFFKRYAANFPSQELPYYYGGKRFSRAISSAAVAVMAASVFFTAM